MSRMNLVERACIVTTRNMVDESTSDTSASSFCWLSKLALSNELLAQSSADRHASSWPHLSRIALICV